MNVEWLNGRMNPESEIRSAEWGKALGRVSDFELDGPVSRGTRGLREASWRQCNGYYDSYDNCIAGRRRLWRVEQILDVFLQF